MDVYMSLRVCVGEGRRDTRGGVCMPGSPAGNGLRESGTLFTKWNESTVVDLVHRRLPVPFTMRLGSICAAALALVVATTTSVEGNEELWRKLYIPKSKLRSSGSYRVYKKFPLTKSSHYSKRFSKDVPCNKNAKDGAAVRIKLPHDYEITLDSDQVPDGPDAYLAVADIKQGATSPKLQTYYEFNCNDAADPQYSTVACKIIRENRVQGSCCTSKSSTVPDFPGVKIGTGTGSISDPIVSTSNYTSTDGTHGMLRFECRKSTGITFKAVIDHTLGIDPAEWCPGGADECDTPFVADADDDSEDSGESVELGMGTNGGTTGNPSGLGRRRRLLQTSANRRRLLQASANQS